MLTVSLVPLSVNSTEGFSFYTNGPIAGLTGPSLERVHPCKCCQVENNGTARTSKDNFMQVMLIGRKMFRILPYWYLLWHKITLAKKKRIRLLILKFKKEENILCCVTDKTRVSLDTSLSHKSQNSTEKFTQQFQSSIQHKNKCYSFHNNLWWFWNNKENMQITPIQ